MGVVEEVEARDRVMRSDGGTVLGWRVCSWKVREVAVRVFVWELVLLRVVETCCNLVFGRRCSHLVEWAELLCVLVVLAEAAAWEEVVV